MKENNFFIDFVQKEWLLITSAAALLATSLYLKKIPYYSSDEFQVLFILLILFITVNGLEKSGIISGISAKLEEGRFIPLKLTAAAFFLSTLITNDVALIAIVPLTMKLKISRKNIIVILEALAANAGSAFTPIGNPQNLYIYWRYNVSLTDFIITIAPFSALFLVILTVISLFIKINQSYIQEEKISINKRNTLIYSSFLILIMLIVLHVIPVYSGAIIIVYSALFDRKTIKIDYYILISFFSFSALQII